MANANLPAPLNRGAIYKVLAITVFASSFLVSIPTTYAASTVGLTISSTGSSSNDGNITLTIPQGGGIATGSQTVKVTSNTAYGATYYLMLSSNSTNTDSTNMVAKDSTNTTKLTPSTGSLDSLLDIKPLDNMTYGFALPTSTKWQRVYPELNEAIYKRADQTTRWVGLQPQDRPSFLAQNNQLASGNQAVSTLVYWGARIDNPAQTRADNYSVNVVYTLIAEEIVPPPTITNVTSSASTHSLPTAATTSYPDYTYNPSTLVIPVGDTTTVPNSVRAVTITGTNLATVDKVYIDLDNNYNGTNASTALAANEQCVSIAHSTTNPDTELTCVVPATTKPGKYSLYVQNPGGISPIVNDADITDTSDNNNKLIYELTTNGLEASSPIITTMQAMTTSVCDNLKPWETTYTRYQLTDIRDNKTYKVRKLADGNCWMVENLALSQESAAANNRTTLTKSDTDLHTNTSWTMPASSTIGASWDFYDNTPHIIQGSTTADGNWQPGMGNWYTWGAATAGTAQNATTGGAVATDSICPAGWQLPGNTGTKSYANLLTTKYGITDSSVGSTKLRSAPLSFTYAGHYDYSGSVSSVGSIGLYWSSTALDGDYPYDGAYDLGFDSSRVYPHSHYGRGRGFSVRCVVH